uniref:Sulfatase domain-containing protein n=1 Tax=Rhabditophanes sp. KR3021 TaxID=114890 RepID=A0AC35TG89_9BILA
MYIDTNHRILFSKKRTQDPYWNYFKEDIYIPNELEIWGEDVYNTIDLKYTEPVCKYNYTNEYVIFEKGNLTLHPLNKNSNCKYQCSIKVRDSKIKLLGWINIQNESPDCDTFEVKCENKSNYQVVFEDLFIQIKKLDKIPQRKATFLKSNYTLNADGHNYSVHIIIIDSLSSSHLVRGLPKTRDILLEKYKAVELKQVNVVGENSFPNAMGLFMNRQSFAVDDKLQNRPSIPGDYSNACKAQKELSFFMPNQYLESGYVTMSSDDWPESAICYDNCRGFDDLYEHHSSEPFVRLKDTNKVYKDSFDQKCKKSHHFQLNYLEEFINKYQNRKRFSYTWSDDLIHDSINNIFAADVDYAKFFTDNQKALENSFIFFGGDHGHRMSTFGGTTLGQYEKLNPALFVAVPKKLRENKELMKNLKDNSMKHVSHFDTYATLLDINTEADRTNFKNLATFNFSTIVKDTIKGLSLFRPIDDKKRDCYTMRITGIYCLYQHLFQDLTVNVTGITKELKSAFVKELNLKIQNNNLTEKCSEMTLNEEKPFKIKFIINTNKTFVYNIVGFTLPGNANYRGYFNEDMSLSESDFFRIDSYREQAEVCERMSPFRKYCYCKSLLTN